MSKAIFLILFLLKESMMTLQDEIHCENFNLIDSIAFPRNQIKCLQVVLNKDNNDVATCMLKIFGLNFILLKMSSFLTLKNRDISSETQENCQTFLIFARTITDVKEIFRPDQGEKKQFFPFSKIYLYIFEKLYDREIDIDTTTQLRHILFKNALFGFILKVKKDMIFVEDILTIDSKQSISSYTPSDLLHPIVDISLVKENFRISLYNCRPFTFYRENASYNT